MNQVIQWMIFPNQEMSGGHISSECTAEEVVTHSQSGVLVQIMLTSLAAHKYYLGAACGLRKSTVDINTTKYILSYGTSC